MRPVRIAIFAFCALLGGLSLAQDTQPREQRPRTAPSTRRSADPARDQNVIRTEQGWFPRNGPGPLHTPLPEKVVKPYIIPIRESITQKTFDAFSRKVDEALDAGTNLIILDMDTWGGAVNAAMDITRLIKTDLTDIHTVCYVRTRAISAGAMIATACDAIYISPGGKYGDSAPIMMAGQLTGVEREKIETVLRNEFRNSANRNGYPADLAVSMVSAHLEVWLVRHRQTRELRYVLANKWRTKVYELPYRGTTRPQGEPDPAAEWEILDVVVPEGGLLTMEPVEAVGYGFAKKEVSFSRAAPYRKLLDELGIQQTPPVLEDTWSEVMVEYLSSPGVLLILLLVGLLGIYVEFTTPGFGLPGTVGVICFALLFGSRFLTGLATWWEIAVFILGLLLIALEIFVIPGFGVAGISGIICCIIALLAIAIPNAPDKLPLPHTGADWDIFTDSLIAMVIALVGALIAMPILSHYLPKIPVAGRLVLVNTPHVSSPGSAATEDAPIRRVEAGQTGKTRSTLRPVGVVQIGSDLMDAVADGGFIDRSVQVRVIRNEGNRLVVEPTDPEEMAPGPADEQKA
ncbi:MAG: NfeD family protein [Phycisphaerae bacterium]